MTSNSALPGLGWATTISKSKSVFQLSPKTLAIPMNLHESARKKVVSILNSRGVLGGIALFKGGEPQLQYDSDTEVPFRQDSWFNYLFGVKEPDFFGVVSLSTGKATLFMPRLPDEYLVWCGAIYPPEHFQTMYDVDDGMNIHTSTTICNILLQFDTRTLSSTFCTRL
jgi:Xaa-Pro dipeptidase